MADVTSTPTTVSYRDQGYLSQGISAAATTIYVGAIYKYPNGVKTKQGLDSTKGFCEITDGTRYEIISFGTAAVDATTKETTLTDVRRGLSQTSTTPTFTAGTGLIWAKGARIRVIDYQEYIQNTAFLDRANTFTDDQTISSTKKLYINDTGTYLYDDGTDLHFKDSQNSDTTLSELTAAAGTDVKVKVSSNDTTSDFLLNKLAAGTGITITETNDAGDEDATIAAVNTVATGHTGLSTVTSGGLLVGAGTSNMTVIGPGTAGQVPLSNGTTIAMGTIVPIGSMMIWTTDSAPTGWLLCYGQAVSRTTYSALFAVVSTTFGVGDGSTTFNLPDLRGRYPLGQDDMGGSSANRVTAAAADTIGSTGGTNDGDHTHTMNTAVATNSGGATQFGQSNQSTSVLPPYQTFNYIIYAAA